ncbi:MAG: hypothetical protein MUP90_02785 [Gammaproteobacteria bacterium]|nr:hypothetical protein [Gammaproteobacteria bacterium]
MKKSLTTGMPWLAAALLFLLANTADARVLQVWNCTLNDGKTVADVEKVSADWLKAVHSMESGKKFEVYLNFPMTGNAEEGSFLFVMIAPDGASWGAFEDSYPGSAASKADAAWNAVADCSGSSLWNSMKME